MPKDIYESLNLWGLSEGGEGISLTNNSIILPIGVAEGVFTKTLGRMVPTDYLVIECVGNGQITLGRSLLKLLGAIIAVGKGTMKFTPHQAIVMIFLKERVKVREVDIRHLVLMLLHLKILDSYFLRLAQRC
jgi:hypothetical protein